MRNIKLTIEYEGTAYHGFQRQLNGVTVQEKLEEALERIVGHPCTVIGAGRTDAGVHARGQVVNFRTTGTIPTERLPLALNSLLPPDIVVKDAAEVEMEFHARYSAKSKVYRYTILNTRFPSAFLRNFAWYIRQPLDVEEMRQGTRLLVGRHDFTSFCAAGGAARTMERTMLRAECTRRGELIELVFEADGFLYNMVRIMAGTLVEIGLGKLPGKGMGEILAARDRKRAGITAPPRGLCLEEVKY